MCGRYALYSLPEKTAAIFGAAASRAPAGSLKPRYNITPGQPLLIVRTEPPDTRVIDTVIWGFVPAHGGGAARGDRPPPVPINARSETVARSPWFADAFRHRRCLVPADAYYEWKSGVPGAGGRTRARQPMAIRAPGGDMLAMAALWEPSPGGATGVILTTAPSPALATIHDRVPLLVPREHWDAWLDCSRDGRPLLEQLRTMTAAATLDAYPVSTRVNDPKRDDESCLRPMDAREPPAEPSLFD
jgi:putative SOS response-associated peptidase YedK